MKKLPLKNKLIGSLLIIFVIVNFVPVGYYILEPGPALEIAEMVEVEESYRQDDWGGFYLTSVRQRRATLWDMAVFYLRPDGTKELVSVDAAIPPGLTEPEYLSIMEELMQESQLSAQAAAYRMAGYDVEVSGEGVRVVEVIEDGQADGILKPEDVITAINGTEVDRASEAVNLIQDVPVGDEIELKVLREEQELSVEITTGESPEDANQSAIGVYITTAGLEYEMPERVSFSTENIIGPSAGTVFALEIYNQLTPQDISQGNRIAGTGTIDFEGNIGPVGGEEQKMIAAEEQGIGYFILPEEHQIDLEDREFNLKILESDNLDNLVDILRDLDK